MAKRNTFSEDEIYDEKFDINQVKRLFHYVKPYRTQIALIAILMLSSSGLSMLIPTFFMKVMDDCIPMGMAGMKPLRCGNPSDNGVRHDQLKTENPLYEPYRAEYRA